LKINQLQTEQLCVDEIQLFVDNNWSFVDLRKILYGFGANFENVRRR
jgi:hypothetical protein